MIETIEVIKKTIQYITKLNNNTSKIQNIWVLYNSIAPPPLRPNFIKRECEGSLDIAIISVVLVFPEFFLFVSEQRLSKDGGVWVFAPKK